MTSSNPFYANIHVPIKLTALQETAVASNRRVIESPIAVDVHDPAEEETKVPTRIVCPVFAVMTKADAVVQ